VSSHTPRLEKGGHIRTDPSSSGSAEALLGVACVSVQLLHIALVDPNLLLTVIVTFFRVAFVGLFALWCLHVLVKFVVVELSLHLSVDMYLHPCIYKCLHTLVCMSLHPCIYKCLHTLVCMSLHPCIDMCLHSLVWMFLHPCVYMCFKTYVYLCLHSSVDKCLQLWTSLRLSACLPLYLRSLFIFNLTFVVRLIIKLSSYDFRGVFILYVLGSVCILGRRRVSATWWSSHLHWLMYLSLCHCSRPCRGTCPCCFT
jgi:hypothetical protein